MEVETEGTSVSWSLSVTATAITRSANIVAAALPDRILRHRRASATFGRLAGPILRAGRVRLTGKVPSGQAFNAVMRRIWVVGDSHGAVDGEDLGSPGYLPEQLHLSDFWLPQKGLFAVVDAMFEPYDASRHQQMASRRHAGRA